MASKGGPLSFILPAALGLGALATGGADLPLLGGAEAAGIGSTVAEGAPGLAEGLLAAAPTAGGEALSIGATPLAAGVADTLGAAAPGGVSGLETIAPAAAGAGGAAGALGGGGLLGPQSGETIDLLSSTLGAPTDLTAGAAGAAPVTTSPLAVADAAGQPLSDAIGTIAQTGIDPTTGGTIDAIASGGGQPQVSLGPMTAPGETTGSQAIDAATAPGAAGGGGGILGGAKDVFSEVGGLKGLTALASAGILGSELLKGPQAYPQQTQLAGQAAGYGQQGGNLLALGNNLANPIQTGALPPGANAAIDLSTAASKAGVASKFADLGLSGSTMEGQALATADQQAAAQKFGVADQMLNSANQIFGDAARFSALGTDTTTNLLKTSMTEDEQYRAALANFAKALGGTGAAIG